VRTQDTVTAGTTRDLGRPTGSGRPRTGGAVRGGLTVRYGAPVRPRPSWLAPVRGVLLAVLATLLTAVGHLAGGGSLEQLSPLAVLVPMLATVLVALAERCRSVVGVLLALGAGQAVLHYLLAILTAHGHHAAVPALSMVAAHAVATLVLAPVVCCADAAVAGLVGALYRLLPRRLRVRAVEVPLPTRAVPDADAALLPCAGLVAAHARRGPPLAC
jgi:hypothetical protein